MPPTNHPEGGQGTAQTGSITTRLTTSGCGSNSNQELLSIGQGAFLKQRKEVTIDEVALMMMTLRDRQKNKKPTQSRPRFDLEKLRNPDVADTFQATIGGNFAPLINLRDDDIDTDSMITTYNTAVTDTASDILWKEYHRKSPW